jgi:hypothetical protein
VDCAALAGRTVTLFPLILAEVMRLAHAPAVDVQAETGRLESIAQAISDAAPDLPNALALLAIAKHESDFAADVQFCRRNGGRAVTLFQLETWGPYTRGDLCTSVWRSAVQAQTVLDMHRRGTWARTFAGYAGGEGTASHAICRSWANLMHRQGLVAWC